MFFHSGSSTDVRFKAIMVISCCRRVVVISSLPMSESWLMILLRSTENPWAALWSV